MLGSITVPFSFASVTNYGLGPAVLKLSDLGTTAPLTEAAAAAGTDSEPLVG